MRDKIPLGRRRYVWDKDRQELKEVAPKLIIDCSFLLDREPCIFQEYKLWVESHLFGWRRADIEERILVEISGVPAKFKPCPVCGGNR